MSESITDELRKYARTHQPYKSELYNAQCADEITAIADRIDKKHEKACWEEYNRGYNDGIDSGFVSADDWLTQNEDEMAEHGWVRMPRDADDVPIRIGDVMEWPDGSTAEVVGIGLDTFFYVEDGNDKADWTVASTKRHHAPDTWERIIEDARTCTGSAGNYTSVPSMRWTSEMDALVARCRALAGEVE